MQQQGQTVRSASRTLSLCDLFLHPMGTRLCIMYSAETICTSTVTILPALQASYCISHAYLLMQGWAVDKRKELNRPYPTRTEPDTEGKTRKLGTNSRTQMFVCLLSAQHQHLLGLTTSKIWPRSHKPSLTEHLAAKRAVCVKTGRNSCEMNHDLVSSQIKDANWYGTIVLPLFVLATWDVTRNHNVWFWTRKTCLWL